MGARQDQPRSALSCASALEERQRSAAPLPPRLLLLPPVMCRLLQREFNMGIYSALSGAEHRPSGEMSSLMYPSKLSSE